MIPYKNQNLDYLHGIEQNPDAYRGKVVSFGGEVKGVTEDARRMRLIIKIDVPFYYYATGKDPLSYQLLLISFDKKGMPQMTGIQKGSDVKVLARVANYETRKNLTGKPIAVLHLIAFALADRNRDRDFFRPEPPYKQLYESWKAGRLFFNEQPQEIEARHPAVQRKTMTFFPLPPAVQEETPKPSKGIVYDEEEPAFILPPDPEPVKPIQTESAEKGDTQESNPPMEETALSAEISPADTAEQPDARETPAGETTAPVQTAEAAQTDDKVSAAPLPPTADAITSEETDKKAALAAPSAPAAPETEVPAQETSLPLQREPSTEKITETTIPTEPAVPAEGMTK